MSIARRFAAVFAGFIASLILMAACGGIAMFAVNEAHDRVHDRLAPLDQRHGRMLQLMSAAQSSLRGFEVTGDSEFLDPFTDNRAAYRDTVEEALDRIGSDESLRRGLVEEADAAGRWYADWGDVVLATLEDGDPGALDRPFGQELFDGMVEQHARTSAMVQARIDDALERARFITVFGAVLMIGYIAAIMAVGIGLAFRLRREVVRPMVALRDTLHRLEHQDLGARAPVAGPAELRKLGEAVNQLAELAEQKAAEDQARHETNSMIRSMSSSIREHLDTATLLSVTVDAVGPALGGDHAIVIRVSTELRPAEIIGEWRRHDGIAERLGTDLATPDDLTALVTQAFLSGQVLAVDDVHADDRLGPGVVEYLSGLDVGSLMLAPIAIGDDVTGVLSVSVFDQPRPWTRSQQSIASTVARELANALRLADLFEREQAMVQQLRALDQAKTDFISSVSHELRTPLTSILGYTELLVDGDVGELQDQQRSMMVVVDRNARRLLLLIDDLLTMSRIEANRLTITPSPVPIGALLEAVADTMRPLADAGGQRLTVDVVDGAGTMWADERAIERVLLNLVSNAVKFTPAGGSITLSGGSVAEGVRLAVADTGMGIPLDEQDQLFTRFFRSSTSRAQAVQGTGLGLAIVRHIVEAHLGSVDVMSEPGRGTTLSFVLPPPPPPSPPSEVSAVEPPPPTIDPGNPQPPRLGSSTGPTDVGAEEEQNQPCHES